MFSVIVVDQGDKHWLLTVILLFFSDMTTNHEMFSLDTKLLRVSTRTESIPKSP